MRLLALAAIALCVACGQAGPLYLPDREKDAAPPAGPPASEETGKPKKETP
jgi:predicted small lipoprotein YifL